MVLVGASTVACAFRVPVAARPPPRPRFHTSCAAARISRAPGRVDGSAPSPACYRMTSSNGIARLVRESLERSPAGGHLGGERVRLARHHRGDGAGVARPHRNRKAGPPPWQPCERFALNPGPAGELVLRSAMRWWVGARSTAISCARKKAGRHCLVNASTSNFPRFLMRNFEQVARPGCRPCRRGRQTRCTPAFPRRRCGRIASGVPRLMVSVELQPRRRPHSQRPPLLSVHSSARVSMLSHYFAGGAWVRVSQAELLFHRRHGSPSLMRTELFDVLAGRRGAGRRFALSRLGISAARSAPGPSSPRAPFHCTKRGIFGGPRRPPTTILATCG